MNMSVIVTVGGVPHTDRYINALKQLECIRNQTYQPIEIIYVEQTIDGNYYFNNLPIPFDSDGSIYKYIPIKFNKHLALYSVAWCRNVGIYKSVGDIVVLMDLDFVFDNKYLETISNTVVDNAYGGWDNIYYIHREERTKYMQYNIFPVGEENLPGRDDNRRNHPGEGGIQIFNREWFINNIVGFPEDMFGWGAEDTDVYERCREILGTRNSLNYTVYHLCHSFKLPAKLINVVIMQRNMAEPIETAALMRSIGVGNIDGPRAIHKDSLRWSLL
jgi:glycosyltransferase involved in cell wall biosynthesis